MAKNTPTETEMVNRFREWYDGASEVEAQCGWRARAVKGYGFYNGRDQWPEGAEKLLRDQGKPALTINRILPVINVILGQQQENPTEIRLYPKKRATIDIANMGSALIKDGMDSSNGNAAVSEAYRDGLITGKGWIGIDQVYEKDPVSGELMVFAPNPLAMYEDPRNTHYNVNEGEFVFRERFVTKGELKAWYPKKFKDAMDATGDDWFGRADVVEGENQNIRQFCGLENIRNGDDLYRGELAGVIVRECWYNTLERVKLATASQNGQSRTVRITGGKDEHDLASFTKKNPNVQIRRTESVVTKLQLAVMVGDVMLKQEDDPLNGMTTFPYVRYSPYWLHGKLFGVVDNLMQPQEDHNKARSNAQHQDSIAGNPGFIGGTPTDKGREDMEKYGSTPGHYFNKNEYGGELERLPPAPVNAGLMSLADVASNDIREISGANPDVTGTNDNSNESGRARLIRVKAGQTTLAPVVANLGVTQAILGEALWDFIRHNDVYSPEEIAMIVPEDTLQSLGGLRGAVAAMNAWDVGTYGVKTGPTKTSMTWRDAQMGDMQEMATLIGSMGLQMTPEVANEILAQVMELSSLPGAEKIAEMLKQQPAQPIPATTPPGPSGASTPARSVASAGGGR